VVVAANQWHLADQGSSDRPSHLAGRLVGEVVTAWVNGADPRPRHTAAAAQSYVAGMLVADRLTARLGSRTPLTAEEIAAIGSAAVPAAEAPWDRAAFEAAMRDVGGTDGSIFEIAQVVSRHLDHHHQGLVQHQLGVPRLRELGTMLLNG
jgi:hypothetical protein